MTHDPFIPNLESYAQGEKVIALWVPRGCGTSRGQTRLRKDANTSRNVAASDAIYAKMRTQVATSQRQTRLREDAAQTRNVAASQRRSVAASDVTEADTTIREDANTSRNVAASDATEADAKTRTQVATSQCQMRLREDAAQTRKVARADAKDANTSRAASDATTRRRRPNSQRRSVAASQHLILVSVRNRFWPPPAKADMATAILTNVIEHLV